MRVAAGAATLPPLARGQRGQAPALNGPLPPSLAALQSMTDLVRPFTDAEREARVEKARQLMASEKIDAIVLAGGASAQYFANVTFGGGERLWAMVIPVKSSPFFVCPAFEEDRAREILAGTPFGKDPDVRVFQEDENPYARLMRA
jgi:Xaa-Pro dipeptidase